MPHSLWLFRGCRHPAAHSAFMCLRGCWPGAGGCPRSLASPPLGLCFAAVVAAPLFFPSPLRGCWVLLTPPPSPALTGSGLVGVWLLLFLCTRSALPLLRALLVSPGGSGFLLPPPPPWFVWRGCCRPAAHFSFSACLLLPSIWFVRGHRRWLLHPHTSSPVLCFSGVAALPLCARSAFLLLPVPFAVCFRLVLPPPWAPRACFCFPGVVACLAWCFAALHAVLCGPWCHGRCFAVPCLFVFHVRCGAAFCCFCPRCAAWCGAVLFGAAVCGVAPCALLSRAAVFFAVPLGVVSCGAVACCSRCVLLFPAGLLFCSLCCAALLLVVRCGAVLLRTVLSPWCSAAFRPLVGAASCCAVPSGAVCCPACCAVLCCAALCCAVPSAVVSWCAVLCCSRCVLLFFLNLLFCVRCCVSWRRAAPRCVLLTSAVQCCCALCCLRGAVLLFLVLLGAVSCCAVPSGAVCFAACCAVLCCAAVCCAVPQGVASWCAVLCCLRCVLLFCSGLCFCVSCCVSWCCAALRGVLLSCALQCCCAMCCLRGAVLRFPALLGAFACCALPSGILRRCGVLCCLVRCFAVLPRAVSDMLCVLCRCVVVCAVFAAVCCAAGALWCSAVGALTSVYFQRQRNCFQLTPAVQCAPCPPCMQQTHTPKKPACVFYYIHGLGLACTPGCVL